MDISKLSAISNLQSSFAEAMKPSKSIEQQMRDAIRPAFEMNNSISELLKHQSSSTLLGAQFSAASQFAKQLAEQTSHWKKLSEPLSQFRESMLLSEQMARALDTSSFKVNSKTQELIESLSATRNAMRMSDEISKQMLTISALHADRFAEISKPYKTLLGSINSDTFATKALREITAQHTLLKQFQLPIIDAATANAIASLWGREGVEKQLKTFGFEYNQLFDHLDTKPSKSHTPVKLKIPPIDFWTAISILMAILMFAYQVRDSAQMEDRLAAEIKKSKHEALNSNQLIGQLLQTLIDMRQPNEDGEVQYVVRTRVTKIRIAPKAGSKVVAEIFPNQVVTLVGNNGKWIEVKYFDWLKQEVRTGWILKKYLIRVPAIKQNAQRVMANE